MVFSKWVSLIVLMCISAIASAQFKRVIVEQVDNGGEVEGRTYRIYIELTNDSDQVHIVYGDKGHPLEIKATSPFFQSDKGGPLSTNVNRKIAKDIPALRFDSWLTIGAADNYENTTTNFLLNLDDFEKNGGAIKSEDGGWFVTPGTKQSYAGPIKRVLIGQFTSNGVITGKFSIMGKTASGEVFHQYDLSFSTK